MIVSVQIVQMYLLHILEIENADFLKRKKREKNNSKPMLHSIISAEKGSTLVKYLCKRNTGFFLQQ